MTRTGKSSRAGKEHASTMRFAHGTTSQLCAWHHIPMFSCMAPSCHMPVPPPCSYGEASKSALEGGNGSGTPKQKERDIRPIKTYWSPEAMAVRARIRNEEVVTDAALRWWAWLPHKASTQQQATPDPAATALAMLPGLGGGAPPPSAPGKAGGWPALDKSTYRALGLLLQQVRLPPCRVLCVYGRGNTSCDVMRP